jgi:hypothetical protein
MSYCKNVSERTDACPEAMSNQTHNQRDAAEIWIITIFRDRAVFQNLYFFLSNKKSFFRTNTLSSPFELKYIPD